MSPAVPVAPPLPWVRAALCAGLIAGVLGSAALALGYALVNPEVPPFHSWPASVAAILLSGMVSGATLGVTISGGMVVARRRGGGTVREVFGAAGGAVVGGLVPSAIGVLGFGSLSTPYIGTDLAAVGVLVAALIPYLSTSSETRTPWKLVCRART